MGVAVSAFKLASMNQIIAWGLEMGRLGLSDSSFHFLKEGEKTLS